MSVTGPKKTLSCSMCLRLEKNTKRVMVCWCFTTCGPVHLISTLSLQTGHI
jgi:hypothetical protein